jgi:hypothetical protein
VAKLDKQERAFFTVKNVLATAQLAGTEDTPLFAGGYTGTKPRQFEQGPTRGEWLAELVDAFDALSTFSNSKWWALGMGNREETEAVGPQPTGLSSLWRSREQGMVVELRRMTSRQTMDQFVKSAFTVYDRIAALNRAKS